MNFTSVPSTLISAWRWRSTHALRCGLISKFSVMSATLEAARVAKLLGDAPVVMSEGRAFPIETRYAGRRGQRIEDDIVDTIRRAVAHETGSMLVFLPGQGEITSRCGTTV